MVSTYRWIQVKNKIDENNTGQNFMADKITDDSSYSLNLDILQKMVK